MYKNLKHVYSSSFMRLSFLIHVLNIVLSEVSTFFSPEDVVLWDLWIWAKHPTLISMNIKTFSMYSLLNKTHAHAKLNRLPGLLGVGHGSKGEERGLWSLVGGGGAKQPSGFSSSCPESDDCKEGGGGLKSEGRGGGARREGEPVEWSGCRMKKRRRKGMVLSSSWKQVQSHVLLVSVLLFSCSLLMIWLINAPFSCCALGPWAPSPTSCQECHRVSGALSHTDNQLY